MTANTETEPKKLRLWGTDAEDLAVISTCLQDAVTCLADMAYVPHERRFALMLNRFRWEGTQADGEAAERVRSGLHFEGVSHVQRRDLPATKTHPLELLAIHANEDGEHAVITFVFAGGGAIRLEAECVDCQLRDVSAPWPAKSVPRHAGLGMESAETADSRK